jgi:hypothetical protein
MALYGLEKTGKSHFCLTAPEPIRIVNTDYGIDELFRAHPEFMSLDVEIEDIPILTPGEHEAAQAALALFHTRYLEWLAYCGERGGTVVLDNATFLWDIVQLVKLEEAKRERFKKQSKVSDIDNLRESRFDYGPVNAYMGAMLRQAFRYPKLNMILIHGTKQLYDDRGQELSSYKMAGFKEVPAIVQALVRTDKVTNGKGIDWGKVIERSRDNPGAEGLRVPNADFPIIMASILGGAS